MMRTRTLLTAGLLSSMRALSRQCPTITPLKIVSITTKPGAVRLSVTTAPRLLRGGFQERRTGRFMFIQILLLEDTHADGVTVFAVNEELMNQLAFYSKPEFTVDVNRFFILFIDDQIQFIEVEYGKSVIHRQFGRA